MAQFAFIYDLLKYSVGSILIGVGVTVLVVGVMFFVISKCYPRRSYSPLSLVVGAILVLFLGFRMITLCGALGLKSMCGDFETYVSGLVSAVRGDLPVSLSEGEAAEIISSATERFPVLSTIAGEDAFAGGDIPNIAGRVVAAVNAYLNQIITGSLWWSLIYIAIASALVIFTLKKDYYPRAGYRVPAAGIHNTGYRATSSSRYPDVRTGTSRHARYSGYRYTRR